jgi:uncharacterized protein (DUF433 family)
MLMILLRLVKRWILILFVGAMGWIVSAADHLGGKPRVRDTRIAVALLLEWRQE